VSAINPGSKSALVLFSGGQDSAVCLGWALERFDRVETIGFDYGQRHQVEMACRFEVRGRLLREFPAWAGRLGEDHVLDIAVLGAIADTALTREREIELAAGGLPNTFVPGRNILFLTLAAALAYRRGLDVLVGGMCETDFSGYPDCRARTIDSAAQTLTLALDREVLIETPLMHLSKAGTWRLAEQLGRSAFVELVREATHTCYLGDRSHLHAWGYGCGACPACDLRAKGWREYRAGAAA
jgi:7-cyano-7-deazaguanine synthase